LGKQPVVLRLNIPKTLGIAWGKRGNEGKTFRSSKGMVLNFQKEKKRTKHSAQGGNFILNRARGGGRGTEHVGNAIGNKGGERASGL